MVQKYFSNITKMLLKSYSKVAFEMIANIAKMFCRNGEMLWDNIVETFNILNKIL